APFAAVSASPLRRRISSVGAGRGEIVLRVAEAVAAHLYASSIPWRSRCCAWVRARTRPGVSSRPVELGEPRVIPAKGDHCVSRGSTFRSEEHTSELQSRSDLVCRLLLEKKN